MSDEPRSHAPLLLVELPTASRDAPTPTRDYNAIHGRFLPGTVFGERVDRARDIIREAGPPVHLDGNESWKVPSYCDEQAVISAWLSWAAFDSGILLLL